MPSEPSISFARIKIQLPRFRGRLVERIDLEERLGAALLSHRLVLLVAAAGYGKTAALARQLSHLPPGCASAWITVDEQDDLPRLLACLVDALEAHDPPWRVAPESLVERASKQAELRAIVNELVNVLAAMVVEHGVIALDDLHLIADPRVYEFLELLLQRAPPHWTLAIATRVEPQLPLARLRAHRELAEFGPSDLSFTQQEIQRLWGAAGQDDSDMAAQDLLERTQGWVAGLCLTLNVLGRAGAPASDRRLSQRHLFDYLASEVFARMSDSWREFFMRCSVLPELTAARCAKLSGNPRAARMLEDIERGGMFVSVLDGKELTLRLHDLFRDFLDDRLRRERPDEIPVLLERAAEDEADPVRKVDLLLRAGAWHKAEALLCEVAPVLLAQGNTTQVTRLIERFPPDARTRSPRLAFTRGLVAWGGLNPEMVAHMRDAAAGFEREGDRPSARRARAHEAYGSVFQRSYEKAEEVFIELDGAPPDLETDLAKASGRYWSAVVNGPPAAVERHLSRVTDLLTDDAPPALWFRFFPWVGMQLATPGVRPLARRIVSGALVAAGDAFSPMQLQARNVEAALLLWEGRVADAEALTRQLRADERWMGRARLSRFGSWRLAILCAALRGDRHGRALAPRDGEVFVQFESMERGIQAIGSAILNDWDAVRKAVAADDGEPDMRGAYWEPFPRVLKARLALHEHREQQALALLRESARTSSQIDRFGLDAMVRVCLAIAEMRTDDPGAAWRAIEPLLGRVLAFGEVGGVLLCGPESLAELAGSQWPAAVPQEGLAEMQRWSRLSRLLHDGANAVEAATTATPADVPLTARELEVLACIAAGDSNKLIARALDLSPHTVKRHVARILERLDLSSRGEAAAWYRRHSPALTAA